MDKKRIVVALGRNAFGETFPEQQANVKKAAKAIADLVEAKYQIVITHSNGPQVGMIQTAMTEFARLEPEDRTVAPMSVCGAMSEGYIGYDLQNAIREELLNRGIYKTVSTIITQVRVDPFDIAFSEPSKIIGRCAFTASISYMRLMLLRHFFRQIRLLLLPVVVEFQYYSKVHTLRVHQLL